jgi:elongation factor G
LFCGRSIFHLAKKTHTADRYRVPRIAFVNKYDREGASLSRTMKMMKERLGAFPIAIQLPLGCGVGFRGVLDVIRQEAIEWVDVDGAKPRTRLLSDAEKKEVAEARVALQEGLCEVDATFLEAYLNGDSSKIEEVNFINSALRRATIAMKAVPCLVGAAFRNKGVQVPSSFCFVFCVCVFFFSCICLTSPHSV